MPPPCAVTLSWSPPSGASSPVSAARQLSLTSLTGALERRAANPEDDGEAGDLASVAVALTPSSERPSLARRLLSAANSEVHDWHVLEGAARATQIRWLADRTTTPREDDWWTREHLDEVVSALRRPSRRLAAQVALVAAVARSRSTVVREFHSRRPAGAVGLPTHGNVRRPQSFRLSGCHARDGHTICPIPDKLPG